MASKSMNHLNGNILCAVDAETTGLIAGTHDIIQICVLPLDSEIKPLNEIDGVPISPFYLDIRPTRPELAEPSAMRVHKIPMADLMVHGVEVYRAADLFEQWFEKLRLPMGKKIMPLGHNYAFDQGFIREWLGTSSYEAFFDYHVRDTASASLFCNDCASFAAESCPYPKMNLAYLASQLEVPHERAHDALQDCLVTAEIYRRMVMKAL